MLDILGFTFPIIYLHLATLACLIPLILYADHQAFSWVTGSKSTLNGKTLKLVHNLTGFGLLMMILSGFAMSISLLDFLLLTQAFLIKMGFVAVLVINSFFIGKLMHVAVERPFKSLSMKESFPLFLSGAVSTLGWVGAFVSALFMGFNEIGLLLNL